MASMIEMQELTKCSICWGVLVNPQKLPCDHSFCAGCLEHLKQGSRIKCPICREGHDVTRIKVDFKTQQIIDALKTTEAMPAAAAAAAAAAATVPTGNCCHDWYHQTCYKVYLDLIKLSVTLFLHRHIRLSHLRFAHNKLAHIRPKCRVRAVR